MRPSVTPRRLPVSVTAAGTVPHRDGGPSGIGLQIAERHYQDNLTLFVDHLE